MTATKPAPGTPASSLVGERELQELRGVSAAVDRTQAMIEFELDGTVITANRNFLDLLKYRIGEVVGEHHRMFCDPEYVDSPAYAQFWEGLRAGEFHVGEYQRFAKDGTEVWINAAYSPVLDDEGRPVKVVKLATDVTATKRESAEVAGKLAAVDRSQAIIEFDLDGTILTANDQFLDLLGYRLDEVAGEHHRIFCEPALVASYEYSAFWERLRAGRYEAGEYKRLGKGGKEVWIQATYNPILDPSGRPFKIIKFASDVTAVKLHNAEIAGRMTAVGRAQAVIEFALDGTVLTANDNFLSLLDYEIGEVVGKHHRMFCEPELVQSFQYSEFWERLRAGEFEAGEFKRLGRGGKEVWIQATYNPILDATGRPYKIVKFASDVTAMKLHNAEVSGRVDAIDRAQAVVEFDLEGVVTSANDNFLRAMGYQLREIVGRHHSDFCSPDYTLSPEYRDFWLRLSRGELISGRFQRVGKFGREVWVQATYNPILDLSGNPAKVVKYAYDVTEEVAAQQRMAANATAMNALVSGLSESIEGIASSSGLATDLAAETQSNAEGGVEALEASLEAISLIQRSSHSISEIARVMGEIANQTNLLAFNASIEAARAGEHGVGFSIVAGEVRKLAERSFEAAQQIGRLIDESAERVEQGSTVSKRAQSAFERIVSGVSRTSEAIVAISDHTRVQQRASAEATALIEQLSRSDVTA